MPLAFLWQFVEKPSSGQEHRDVPTTAVRVEI